MKKVLKMKKREKVEKIRMMKMKKRVKVEKILMMKVTIA